MVEEVVAEVEQDVPSRAVVSEFTGHYFDGVRSKAHPVTVSFDGEFVQVSGGMGWLEVPLAACTLEPPLGKEQRRLTLPGGAHCETREVEAFAALEEASGQRRGLRFVHRLESGWRLALGCLVGLVASVGAFTLYGIPFLATQAAYATPAEVSERVSRKSFDLLDAEIFEPSALSTERAGGLQRQFSALTADFAAASAPEAALSYELVFRSGGALGANAFALPSGLIIMTDELVELAENDREILSVLAHEVAHVEKRHGLRSLYQGAGVFMLVSILVGDVASVTSVAASLPAILVESGYSRAFEREADEVAGRYLVAKGWGTEPLRDILARLTEGVDAPTFLSSHPGTEARLDNLEALEEPK